MCLGKIAGSLEDICFPTKNSWSLLKCEMDTKWTEHLRNLAQLLTQKRSVRSPRLRPDTLSGYTRAWRNTRMESKRWDSAWSMVWDMWCRSPKKNWEISELRPHQAVGMEPPGWGVIDQDTPQQSYPTWKLVNSSQHHKKMCTSPPETLFLWDLSITQTILLLCQSSSGF